MTTPSVNGSWSVKDNLAHLAAWQNCQAARQEGVLSGTEPPDPASGRETEDEINEFYYQRGSVGAYTMGNTYRVFEVHHEFIQRWMNSQGQVQ